MHTHDKQRSPGVTYYTLVLIKDIALLLNSMKREHLRVVAGRRFQVVTARWGNALLTHSRRGGFAVLVCSTVASAVARVCLSDTSDRRLTRLRTAGGPSGVFMARCRQEQSLRATVCSKLNHSSAFLD